MGSDDEVRDGDPSTDPLTPGSMLDVATAAGVSMSTVSRALRGSPSVRPETAARVRAAADALGFSVSPSAAGLATGKVKRIAVLLGSPLTDWFSGSVLDVIYRVLRSAGFDLLLYRVHDPEERRQFFQTLPARRNADALIVASFLLTVEEQQTLARMHTPVVYLNQRVSDRPSVGIDDVAAGKQAVRYLHGLGHRNFRYARAYLEEGFAWSASDRYDGFRAELAAVGIPSGQGDLIEAAFDDDFGPAVVARLVSGELPVAVVAEHDELAMRILLALWQQGVRVPEDVSVIGFDGQDRSARFGLTTIAQPVADLATAAAELAVRLARGELPPTEAQRVELPTAIRASRSTRAVRTHGD
jgi:DNA-binding LacI/PurR family transcriptional regulator